LGYDQLFDQVRNAPLLILDDIDAVSCTPWAKEKLFQVVNHRFKVGLATVFTTTQSPGDLEDRLATRLADAALSRVFSLGDGSGAIEQYRQVGGMTRERLDHKTFADFVTRSDLSNEEQANLMAARQAVSDWAERPWGWLVLLG